jgi:N-acetylglucosaminyldiphosphoundecaprenol N-acetyl-beta-D-mannosaminyltransferase
MDISAARTIDTIPSTIWPDDLGREVYGVFGFPLDVIDMASVVRRIESADNTSSPFLISTANLNYLVNSQSNFEFRNSLLESDLCTADGMPIVWIPRLLGVPIDERIAGSDIIKALKTSSDPSRRLKVFFFGGPEGVGDAACKNINATAKNMACVGSYFPGYKTVDELSADAIIDRINSSGADFLVVCLGSQKGQAWLQRNHDRIQIPIRVHLGAAVKYEAGIIKRAPLSLQKRGLEWLWRIKEEPNLFGRYLVDGLLLIRLFFSRVIPLYIFDRWSRLRFDRKIQNLFVARSEDEEAITLRLTGAATARHVNDALPYFQEALIAEKPILINFADIGRIDARFIGLLLMLRKQLNKRQLSLRFGEVPLRIRTIFQLSGFGFLLRSEPEM